MLASLESILEYKHSGVIRRFQKDFPQKKDRAEVIFSDLMRFFWISKKHQRDQKSEPKIEEFNFIFIMDEEMKEIDQMWHIFLLYTQDYADFCQKYFGEFLHHLPDIVENLPEDQRNFSTNLERFLNYTYDLLGEDVVRRWFQEVA